MRTLRQVADAVQGRLDGPADLPLDDVAPVDRAGPREVTFVKDARHVERLACSRAGAVLCRPGDDVGARPAVRVANPRLAAAIAIALFHPPRPPTPFRHPQAAIDATAVVPPSCHVSAFAVVEQGAVLGERVTLRPHAVVGAACRVGDDSVLEAGVVLYPGVALGARCEIHAGAVIGSPGFGYEIGPEGPLGLPQRGTVILGDDVRVGANTTVDRATFDATRIGDKAKIDNLVQVGHNVTVADGVVICALSGLAGGATLERGAVLGPQGALAPDAVLGEGTILGARGALQSHGHLHDPGRIYMGTPPIPLEDWRRWVVLRRRLRRGRGRLGGSPPEGPEGRP